jgi:hypothetical protein
LAHAGDQQTRRPAILPRIAQLHHHNEADKILHHHNEADKIFGLVQYILCLQGIFGVQFAPKQSVDIDL